MKNLITMVDFVLEQHEQCVSSTNTTYKYAKFLKQKLELWMFVPCHLVDGVWKILEYPDDAKEYIFRGDSMRHEDLQDYQRAKERCLFVWQNGFDYKGICKMFLSIEDIIEFKFKLTPLANKLLEYGI